MKNKSLKYKKIIYTKLNKIMNKNLKNFNKKMISHKLKFKI